ncbi:MAG: hypothetical protein LQ345_006530 [Seirophora villosa]|nr:MAG: hypothetical protein LQ345_006530 [Seirophora villosa]
MHPAPVLTPPLSTKSLSPNGRTSTHVAESGFVEKTRPQPSLQKTFDYYNPNAEKRSKEKSKRTCMSCYNRNDRKITDNHQQLLDNPRFDAILDGNAYPVGAVGCSNGGNGSDHLEGIQIASRRLCLLLRLLAHPDQNIVHFSCDNSVNPALLGMPMVKLAYEIAPLLTHLEYLGKGIEMRSFEAEPSASPRVLQDYGLSVERTKRKLEDLQSQLHEVEQTTSHLKEQLRQTMSHLKGRIREKEQAASNLKEDIQYGEMMLGVVTKALDHGTLDDPLLPTSSDAADQSESPGAMTLVDSGLEAAIPSAIKEEATDEFPMPNLASHLMDEVDTPMHDSLANYPGGEIDQTLVEIKKRKRFSSHLTSKKVRVHNQAQLSPEISTLPSCKTDYTDDKPCDSGIDGRNVSQPPVNDGSEPRSTSRPTSWPRARLFRRSAGVSVKKLTDAFEKLRMKQAQP